MCGSAGTLTTFELVVRLIFSALNIIAASFLHRSNKLSTMADTNGFTTVSHGKKKRRNRRKKSDSETEVPANQPKAAAPEAQSDMPGVSSHMVPYMKAAQPHGFSLEEVRAMNDRMFAEGSEVWNDPQAVLAELLKTRVSAHLCFVKNKRGPKCSTGNIF